MTYCKSVSKIDNQRAMPRHDGLPFVVGVDLETANLILMEDCESRWIAVGPRAEGQPWLLAWRVEVASHYGATIFEEVFEVGWIHPQTHSQDFHYGQGQILHGLTIFFKYAPINYYYKKKKNMKIQPQSYKIN